jgi:fluoride exporter
MKIILSIALGGSVGALSRYYVSRFVNQFPGAGSPSRIAGIFGTLFPIGTLAVNLGGALFIGFFYRLFEKTIVAPELRSFITIGFLGAFTTFSTFALENINLLRDGEIKLACINICISNILGLLCVLGGMYLAGLIVQK